MSDPISNLDKIYWDSEINDIPCVVRVDNFTPGSKAIIGRTPEESEEGYPDDLDITVLDYRNIKAPWLERQVTPKIMERFWEEFDMTLLEIKHCYQG